MKKYIPLIITAVIVGGIGFYSGMQFTQGKSFSGGTGANGFGQRQGGEGQGRMGNRGSLTGGGFVNGSILAVDDKSITIKLRNGGSQIIFFSGSTHFQKFIDVTAQDAIVGKNIGLIFANYGVIV